MTVSWEGDFVPRNQGLSWRDHPWQPALDPCAIKKGPTTRPNAVTCENSGEVQCVFVNENMKSSLIQ
jgi:hypothetical protein